MLLLAYCAKCDANRPLRDAERVYSVSGRSVIRGACSDCGGTVLSYSNANILGGRFDCPAADEKISDAELEQAQAQEAAGRRRLIERQQAERRANNRSWLLRVAVAVAVIAVAVAAWSLWLRDSNRTSTAAQSPSPNASNLDEALTLRVYLSRVEGELNRLNNQIFGVLSTLNTNEGVSKYKRDPVKYALWQEQVLTKATRRFSRSIRYLKPPEGVRHDQLRRYGHYLRVVWVLGAGHLEEWLIERQIEGSSPSFKEKEAQYWYYVDNYNWQPGIAGPYLERWQRSVDRAKASLGLTSVDGQ